MKAHNGNMGDCVNGLAVHLDHYSSGSHTSDETNSPVSSHTSHSEGYHHDSSQTSPLDAHHSSGSQHNDNPSSSLYKQRRKRNNEAAKKCRANRRALFEQRLNRARELEVENESLKKETYRLSNELQELRRLLDLKNVGGDWQNAVSQSSLNQSLNQSLSQSPNQSLNQSLYSASVKTAEDDSMDDSDSSSNHNHSHSI